MIKMKTALHKTSLPISDRLFLKWKLGPSCPAPRRACPCWAASLRCRHCLESLLLHSWVGAQRFTEHRCQVGKPNLLDPLAVHTNEGEPHTLKLVGGVHPRQGAHGPSGARLRQFSRKDFSLVILPDVQAALSAGNREVSFAAMAFLPCVSPMGYNLEDLFKSLLAAQPSILGLGRSSIDPRGPTSSLGSGHKGNLCLVHSVSCEDDGNSLTQETNYLRHLTVPLCHCLRAKQDPGSKRLSYSLSQLGLAKPGQTRHYSK